MACYVFYQSLKPAMKGFCRVVLQADEELPDMGGRIIGVEARKAWLGTTQREVKAIGVVKSNADVVIRTELPTGKISEILFTEGAEVTKGQDLIKFEDGYYLSEKNKYEAEYIMRKGEFDRVKKLYSQKVGTQKTYDEALAGVTAAKAQLDSAAFQLSKTVIKAPFTGTIGILKGSATPGNIVQQNTELVTIVDNSVVKIEFMVPVKYIDDIAVGQNVEISVDAYKGRAFSGAVDAIDSEVDVRNHSILVRAVIPNKNGALKHGMFASVKLVTGEKSDVILIDEDALDREGSIEFVWVIDEKNRAYRKRVLTGAKDASGVEVLAGLKDGDIVVVTGQLKLTDGSLTKILNKSEMGEDSTDDSDKGDSEPATEESTNNEESAKDGEDTPDSSGNEDDGGDKKEDSETQNNEESPNEESPNNEDSPNEESDKDDASSKDDKDRAKTDDEEGKGAK
ncbi:MAG: efflux RND transporter periplasmic adaptor subunit [Holosporales bacterium]|nr:efflux RND transporter periplasmic adaptor subunit [Holosporales bacterium]